MRGSEEKLSDIIIGAWTLETYEAEVEGGGGVMHPLGADAQGLIVYTSDGYMSVQVSAAGRPKYSDGQLYGGTEAERAAAANGYLAYAGTYELQGDVVTHHPFVSLFPNWEGASVPRQARYEDGVLNLDLLPPSQPGAHARKGTLRWRRFTAS